MRSLYLVSLLAVAGGACKPSPAAAGGTADAPPASAASLASAVTNGEAPAHAATLPHARKLHNLIAYIPPQCFTQTRTEDGKAKNPCYACHTRSQAPNVVDDGDLQVTLKLPVPGEKNPWTNLLDPPIAHAP